MGCAESKPEGGRRGGVESLQGGEQEAQRRAKVVMLGESGCGKSCIALRYMRGFFPDESNATVGAAFHSTQVRPPGGKLRIDLWDTAGQERYSSLAPLYYRGAVCAILVYDITRRDSFERAQRWVDELRGQPQRSVLLLVGNKLDVAEGEGGEARQVSKDEAESFSRSMSLDAFWEVSAKTGDNIPEAFEEIVRLVDNVLA